MKNLARVHFLILAATLAGAGLAAPAGAQQPLTLREFVTRVLEHNPDLAADGPAREAARADLQASRAGYLPRLDFEQSYAGGNNPVYVFGTLLTQRRFTAANFALSSLNSPDAVDNLQTRLSARQTLWDFGRTKRRMESAATGAELVDRGHENHVRHVLLAALDTYYSVSLAREAHRASQVALESAAAIHAQARSRVESGLAVEADLLRSQAHLAAARQREIQARSHLETARAALNRIMGQPLDSPLGETAPLAPAALPLPTEESLAAEQLARRPDYQAKLAEMRLAELEVRNGRGEFLPVVGAFASWEMDNPSLKDYGGNNWTAGVSLRWNLFAGGADAARLQAARHRLEQRQRELRALESAMALELRASLLQAKAAEEQVDVTRAAQAQAEEGLRILKNRYDAGLATMTDLLSAETARAAARTAFAEAVYHHRISFAGLESAAGLLSPSSKATQP